MNLQPIWWLARLDTIFLPYVLGLVSGLRIRQVRGGSRILLLVWAYSGAGRGVRATNEPMMLMENDIQSCGVTCPGTRRVDNPLCSYLRTNQKVLHRLGAHAGPDHGDAKGEADHHPELFIIVDVPVAIPRRSGGTDPRWR